MEFGSINRRLRKPRSYAVEQSRSRARRSFSTSNLSFRSTSSVTSLGKRSLVLTLPKELECELGPDGRVLHMLKGGPAHASGVIQIGDYLRVFKPSTNGESCSGKSPDVVTVHVTFGILQVDTRPQCPFVIKIGNRSNTRLGIAVGEAAGQKIKISSIQAGSLADRCGFLQPGDVISTIQLKSQETIRCSNYYTCFQVAQILRKLASTQSSITMTIIPVDELSNDSSDDGSGSTATLRDSSPSTFTFLKDRRSSYTSFLKGAAAAARRNSADGGGYERGSVSMNEYKSPSMGQRCGGTGGFSEVKSSVNVCVLSLSLWKDRLYEDWGFSLVGPPKRENGVSPRSAASVLVAGPEPECSGSEVVSPCASPLSGTLRRRLQSGAAIVHQIRHGGPAFTAGLLPGDRILKINEKDVQNLESTILVPILASLGDALNLIIERKI